MAVQKPTISMDADLKAEVDRLARAEGTSFSAFVTDAVDAEVRRRHATEALLALIGEWEAEHGEITAEELAVARGELGLPAPAERVSQPRRRSTAAPASSSGPSARAQGAKPARRRSR